MSHPQLLVTKKHKALFYANIGLTNPDINFTVRLSLIPPR
jgi:hypothetical protein